MKVLGYALLSELHHPALLSPRYSHLLPLSIGYATAARPPVPTPFPPTRENPQTST